MKTVIALFLCLFVAIAAERALPRLVALTKERMAAADTASVAREARHMNEHTLAIPTWRTQPADAHAVSEQLATATHAQRILVQPRPGITPVDLDRKLGGLEGKRVDYIRQINVYIVEVPTGSDPRAAAARLRLDTRDINFAEMDERVVPADMSNDRRPASVWHLTKPDVQTARDPTSGAGVTVAILDTGIDPLHPDLAPSLVRGYNFHDNNSDTRDMDGHGTKVAGTVSMVANKLADGVGIAFAANLMPIRVTDGSGYGYFSAMAKGIAWAADNGARIASLSFQNVCGSSTMHAAANYMRGKGGVVIAAGGNTGVLEALPVSDNITCVSATDSADNRANWSSYGDYIDVAAPGAAVHTTAVGGTHDNVSGTSFSASITAAVYALMMSANRLLTPAQLDSIVLSTAKDLGPAGKDLHYGHGRIDAAAAVAQAMSGSSESAPPPALGRVEYSTPCSSGQLCQTGLSRAVSKPVAANAHGRSEPLSMPTTTGSSRTTATAPTSTSASDTPSTTALTMASPSTTTSTRALGDSPTSETLLVDQVKVDTDLRNHPDVLWYPRWDSWANVKADWSTYPNTYGDAPNTWPKLFFTTAPEFGNIPAGRFESVSTATLNVAWQNTGTNIMQMNKYFNENTKFMLSGTTLGNVPLNDLYLRYCLMAEASVWAGINETGMKLPGLQVGGGELPGEWMWHSIPGAPDSPQYSPPYSLSQQIRLTTYFHGGDLQAGSIWGKDWIRPPHTRPHLYQAGHVVLRRAASKGEQQTSQRRWQFRRVDGRMDKRCPGSQFQERQHERLVQLGPGY